MSSIHSAIASNNKIYQRSVDDESAKIAKIGQHKIFWRSLLTF
ncbi:hypothetical protein [Nostoc sp. DedQUE09]|nr:hypothetical protein [Nostoc sp. DedQUE09]